MEIAQLLPKTKNVLTVINQLCELERKVKSKMDHESLLRNINRMKDAFEESGLVYVDPIGQSCPDTRTDVEASIAGAGTEDLVVIEVLKPIVRQRNPEIPGDAGRVVQKGRVVVESQSSKKE